jgi:hypothetical protein
MSARTNGRIILPKNPAELLDLATKIYLKHQSDGVNSPLNAQQDFNWTVEGPKVTPCKNYHDKAEEAAKLAEKYYSQ